MVDAKKNPDAEENSDTPNFSYLTVLRYQISQKEKGWRNYLYNAVAELCSVGELLRQDNKEWRLLVNANWGKLKRPKLSDQENALRHTFRWAIGTSHLGEKSASFYYNAVAPLIAQGLEGNNLLGVIRKKGFKRLQAEHSRSRKAKSIMKDPGGRREALKPKSTTVSIQDEANEKQPASSAIGGALILPTQIRFRREPKHLYGLKAGTPVKITGKLNMSEGRIVVDDAKFKVRN